jgi:hypothetical protein
MSDERTTAVTTLTPVTILEQAVKTGANVDVIEKLMGLQERWERHQAEKAFVAALAEAKPSFGTILKNNKVDQVSRDGRRGAQYTYEDLPAVCEAVDKPLADNGLYYRWRTSTAPNGLVTVTCILSHELGYSEETTLSAPPDTSGAKNPAQAVASTTTFLQRYTLKAALGVAAEKDDDGRGGKTETVVMPLSEYRLTIITKLKAAADLSDDDLAKMLNACNAANLDEIKDDHFDRVVGWLTRTIEKNNQKKQEEPGAHEPDA